MIKHVRLKIRGKILLGFLVVCIIIFLNGYMNLNVHQALKNAINEVGRENAPLVDAAMEIKITSTEAHLWLEEVISGAEPPESIEIVKELIDDAIFFANAIISGGSNYEGTFIPTDDPEIRSEAENVLSLLTTYRETAVNRYDLAIVKKQTEKMQSLDDQFDKVYEDLINESDELEVMIKDLMDKGIKSAEKTANMGQLILIITLALILLLSIIIGIVLSNIIVRPLKRATFMMQDIAEGEGDLTKRLNVKARDEIGELAKWFNKFLDNVREIVTKVGNTSEQVATSAEQLTATSQQSSVTAEEVAQTVNEIAEGASDQANSTSEGSERLIELGQLIEANKTQIEELNGASNTVSKLVEEGLTIVDDLTEKTKANSEASEIVYKNTIKTNDSSNKISEASELIASIAEQTNLLALNAAIEAARAGEHGTGFAVVADEIRKLAEQSTRSTEVIDEIVKTLKEDAETAVKKMEESSEIVKAQENSVELTESKFKVIADAMSKATEAVSVLNEASMLMGNRKNEVQDAIQTLSALAEENAAGTEEVSASMEEQTVAIEEIANASEGLSQLANELQSLVKKFKV